MIVFTTLTTHRAQVWVEPSIAVDYTIFLDLPGFADVVLVLRPKSGDEDYSISLQFVYSH
jgi:hypothetical protein